MPRSRAAGPARSWHVPGLACRRGSSRRLLRCRRGGCAARSPLRGHPFPGRGLRMSWWGRRRSARELSPPGHCAPPPPAASRLYQGQIPFQGWPGHVSPSILSATSSAGSVETSMKCSFGNGGRASSRRLILDGLLPVPVPAGPGLVHHAPPEFILVEDAQRGDHEVEVPEHAAQLPGALVLQVGDDDVREAVPRVVPQDERQVLEGKGLVFRIGGDASARVPELGDPAELEERRAEPAPKDGGDRRLAGAGSLCEKDERPHEQTLVTPDDRAISLTGPGRGRDGAGWPGVGGYGRPGLAGRRASRL